MLCFVRQPNSVILEIEVPPKAKGKQCLEKVCSHLGIIESDYVGLQYVGPNGENLWVNLRNQLRHQLTGLPPYRLNLRIKFYVPPHLVLQDTTRHLFYLDAYQEFICGHFRLSNAQVIQLAALIAQSELGDLNASNQALAVLNYPNFLPESDTAVANDSGSINTTTSTRVRWCSGESNIADNTDAGCCSIYAEHEDFTSFDNSKGDISSSKNSLYQVVMNEHIKLSGMKPKTAEYLFLEKVSCSEDFGAEHFSVKNTSDDGQIFRISVGPVGLSIYDAQLNLKFSISYAGIQLASHTGRCFFLNYVDNHGEVQSSCFKLESCHRASALYRTLTEKHAFYSCETVRNTVTSQFIRDLKGTIASIFNENTALGKNYVFDISRTFREVYDQTRRLIYQAENQYNAKPLNTSDINENTSSTSDVKISCRSSSCKVVKDQLTSLHDSLLCKICMNLNINTVFFPCKHVICCVSCASVCTSCPLCRTDVKDIQQIYLPFLEQQHSVLSTQM